MPNTKESERSIESRTIAVAIGSLYAGGLIAILGVYSLFWGGQGAAGGDEAAPAYYGTDQALVEKEAQARESGRILKSLVAVALGVTLGGCGWWALEQFKSGGETNADVLRRAYREGVDVRTLHTNEDLESYQEEVERRRQNKVLWSLPFWLTTLWFLIIGKGQLGATTMLGLSNLWLMALTLGVSALHRFYYWRCPACDARLPKYDPRLSCTQCGVPLAREVRFGEVKSGQWDRGERKFGLRRG